MTMHNFIITQKILKISLREILIINNMQCHILEWYDLKYIL